MLYINLRLIIIYIVNSDTEQLVGWVMKTACIIVYMTHNSVNASFYDG